MIQAHQRRHIASALTLSDKQDKGKSVVVYLFIFMVYRTQSMFIIGDNW
jgi:hypothetical protein